MCRRVRAEHHLAVWVELPCTRQSGTVCQGACKALLTCVLDIQGQVAMDVTEGVSCEGARQHEAPAQEVQIQLKDRERRGEEARGGERRITECEAWWRHDASFVLRVRACSLAVKARAAQHPSKGNF